MTFWGINYTRAFCLLVAGTIVAGAPPAQAQPVDPAPQATQKEERQTIVVTARKTEESLLETPVAVSVVGAQFFERTGINTIQDLVRFVPGFDLTPLNTSRATGSKVRGISTFSFSDGFESSVATVIDGVVMGREAQGLFDLFDVQSVEIIKGPQGTLFGKNASAGVVNITTKRPEFEFGVGGDLTYGRYDEVKLRGSVTGPVVEDKVAIRLTGTMHRHDGILNNALPGEDDLNDKDTWAARAKILFTPSENFEAILSADILREENRCCLPTFRNAGPPSIALLFALNSPVLQLGDALDSLGIVPGVGNRQTAVADDRILQESEAGGVALEMNYDMGWATLTSITSWRTWKIDEFNEADSLSLSNVNDRNGTESSSEQFSQELRLAGRFLDRVDFVAGLYYFHQDLDADGTVNIELSLPFPPFFNVSTNAARTVKNDSYALFGEFTIDVTEDLSLILGGRLTREELKATYDRVSTPINPLAPFGPFFGPNVSGAQSVNDTNFSGRAILRYFWDDHLMTYFSFSRGYKGPGIDVAESVDVNAIAVLGGLPILPPEIPTLFELGFKGRFFDDSLSINATLFHQQVKNLQAIASDDIGTVTNLSIDRVRSRGIEMDLVYNPAFIEGLTLTVGVTYLDIEIRRFAERQDLEGIRFRDNPKWTYSIIGDYGFQITNSGYSGFFRAEWYWQDDKNTNLDRQEFAEVSSYGLLNLRVGVASPDENYGATFSVENVFDKEYAHFILGTSYAALDGNATNGQFIGMPRKWSITLWANF